MTITSIGWLHRADGDVNLTPCFDGNMFPVKVHVTKEEYKLTDGDEEKMKELAMSKLKM